MRKIKVDSLRANRERRGTHMESELMTRNCFCCGKPLSDPRSLSLGVGPVCALHLGLLSKASALRLPKDAKYPCSICGVDIRTGEKAVWEFNAQGEFLTVAHIHCKDVECNGEKFTYENYTGRV
jgi:hypothetical protein